MKMMFYKLKGLYMTTIKELYKATQESLAKVKITIEESGLSNHKLFKPFKIINEEIDKFFNAFDSFAMDRHQELEKSHKLFEINMNKVANFEKKSLEEIYKERGYILPLKELKEKILSIQEIKDNYPNFVPVKSMNIQPHFYEHILNDIALATKNKSHYGLKEFETSLNTYLQSNNMIGVEDRVSLETVVQPIMKGNTNTIKKMEVLTSLHQDFKTSFSKNHTTVLNHILGDLKGQSLLFLSDYANGTENGTNVPSQVASLMKEKGIEIDTISLERIKRTLSNELVQMNLDGIKNKQSMLINANFASLCKQKGLPITLDKDYVFTLNFGKNDINSTVLNTLKNVDKTLKDRLQIEFLEHYIACLDDKPIYKALLELSVEDKMKLSDSDRKSLNEIEMMIEISKEVKSMGTKVLADDIQSTKRMYQRMDNLHELFGENFKTIKVDKEITKKLNLYSLLKNIDIDNFDFNNNENKEIIVKLIKDYSFIINKECGFKIGTVEDFKQNIDALKNIANEGMYDFLKLNYYNTHHINDKQSFYNDVYQNITPCHLIDTKLNWNRLENNYGKNFKSQNEVKEMNYEYLETGALKKDIDKFHLDTLSYLKNVNVEVPYSLQGYYYFENLTFKEIEKSHISKEIVKDIGER